MKKILTKEQADSRAIFKNCSIELIPIRISTMPEIELCIVRKTLCESAEIEKPLNGMSIPVSITADLITNIGERIENVTVNIDDIEMFDEKSIL